MGWETLQQEQEDVWLAEFYSVCLSVFLEFHSVSLFEFLNFFSVCLSEFLKFHSVFPFEFLNFFPVCLCAFLVFALLHPYVLSDISCSLGRVHPVCNKTPSVLRSSEKESLNIPLVLCFRLWGHGLNRHDSFPGILPCVSRITCLFRCSPRVPRPLAFQV